MRLLATILVLVTVALTACQQGADPLRSQSEQTEHSFGLFSAAHAARTALEEKGVTATRITFSNGSWRFVAGGQIDADSTRELVRRFSVMTDHCQSESEDGKSGTTTCTTFTDAEAECEAMKDSGNWGCTEVYWSTEKNGWTFDWFEL